MIVDDLTKLHPNMKYLCAPSGGNRVIRYIDIVEIPEGSAWTSPGDFIITTGYFIQDTTDFERLVLRLIKNQGVGLGIKIGKYVHDIPTSVREIAEDHHFPILVIPMELSYRDIQTLSLHARKEPVSSNVQSSGRGYIVEFYSQILLGNDHNLTGLRALSEKAGLNFHSDRLVFTASMDATEAKDAVNQLLLRPSPDFFLLYDNMCQHIIGIFNLRPGTPVDQGHLYGQQLFYTYCTSCSTIGISELSSSANTLRSAYHHARFALKVGKTVSPRKPFHRYTDYIEYDFIRENMNSDILLQLVAEYLQPVLNYNEKKSADLLKTLYICDECDYNMQQACTVLGIHRNTLYDRIRKIGKLLHHDLNAKYVQDVIHIALTWHTLTQLE